MAKAAKKKAETPAPKKRGKYDDKLQVNGSFMDIMHAAMKDADKKSAKKKDQ